MMNTHTVQMASDNGDYLLSSLKNIQDNSDGMVSNARGKGLFCAYDLPSEKHRNQLIKNMENEGALILGCGHQSIRFRPHLNISKEEINQAISMMKISLSKL